MINNKPIKTNIMHLALFFSLVLSLLLIACGGGSSLENGVGGTGITQGRISELKSGQNPSITVNQIEFDTRNAAFIRDGKTVEQQSDFKPGEIITIEGQTQGDGTQGIATKVIFDDTLEGPVTAEANGNHIEILGQTVLTDSNTLFYGFNDLEELIQGFVVEVSGFIIENNQILASTLALQQTIVTVDAKLEIKGHATEINITDKTFKINNLLVDYSAAVIAGDELKEDVYVVVRSLKPLQDKRMFASKIFILNNKLDANTFYKKNGVINRVESPSRFEIDGIPVMTQIQTRFVNGSKDDLKINQKVIISGYTNESSELLADEIYFIERQSFFIMEGYIDAINQPRNKLSVLDTSIIVDDVTQVKDERTETLLDSDFRQFQTGDFIYVEVYKDTRNNKFVARYLAKIPEDTLVRALSMVQSSDEQQNSIRLFNHKIRVDEQTRYFDEHNQTLSKQAFFARLQNQKIFVDVVGFQAEPGVIIGDTLYLETRL